MGSSSLYTCVPSNSYQAPLTSYPLQLSFGMQPTSTKKKKMGAEGGTQGKWRRGGILRMRRWLSLRALSED